MSAAPIIKPAQVRVGDTLKVTLQGVVEKVWAGGSFRLNGLDVLSPVASAGVIERTATAAIQVGDLVRHSCRAELSKPGEIKWRDDHHAVVRYPGSPPKVYALADLRRDLVPDPKADGPNYVGFFSVGDTVNLTACTPDDKPGLVVKELDHQGFVTVQWPQGQSSHYPSTLIHVLPLAKPKVPGVFAVGDLVNLRGHPHFPGRVTKVEGEQVYVDWPGHLAKNDGRHASRFVHVPESTQ